MRRHMVCGALHRPKDITTNWYKGRPGTVKAVKGISSSLKPTCQIFTVSDFIRCRNSSIVRPLLEPSNFTFQFCIMKVTFSALWTFCIELYDCLGLRTLTIPLELTLAVRDPVEIKLDCDCEKWNGGLDVAVYVKLRFRIISETLFSIIWLIRW